MYSKSGSESTTAAASKGRKISKGLVRFHLSKPKLTIRSIKEAEKEKEEKEDAR